MNVNVSMAGAIEDPWICRGGGLNVRANTRDCRAALFPVCESPSSFRIFFRSLLISVLERSVMVAARCCRLDAMARVLLVQVRISGAAVVSGGRGRRSWAAGGVSRQVLPGETWRAAVYGATSA